MSLVHVFAAIGRLKDEANHELKDGLVTEELISLKRNSDEDGNKANLKDEVSDKRNWLRSVQLWNTNNDCDFRNKDSELKLVSFAHKFFLTLFMFVVLNYWGLMG